MKHTCDCGFVTYNKTILLLHQQSDCPRKDWPPRDAARSHADIEAGAPAGDAVAWRHTIAEPRGSDSVHVMYSARPDNPWSHWTEKHKDECDYTREPLYAHPSPPIDGLVERLTAEQRELEGDARTLRGYIKEFGETPSMTASRASSAEARLAASERERDEWRNRAAERDAECDKRAKAQWAAEARLAASDAAVGALTTRVDAVRAAIKACFAQNSPIPPSAVPFVNAINAALSQAQPTAPGAKT